MMLTRTLLPLPLVIAAALALPGAAVGVTTPPSNDNRADAKALGALPATVTGTTANATVEKVGEPAPQCGQGAGSVWYSFTADADGRVSIAVQNNGKLDSVVDVFLSQRSQITPQGCDLSDSNGRAETDLQAKKGETYLVRVSQLFNSVPGTFRLDVASPAAPARPPGKPLTSGGVSGILERVLNPDDAFSRTLHAGTTYRINLSGRGESCDVSMLIYSPGTTSFDTQPFDRFSCDDYATFTPRPGESGRYSFRVQADRGVRGPQLFHLEIAPAGPDDVAPGHFIGNYARVHGVVDGGRIDAVDLYRFDVTKRSDLTLRLSGSGGPQLELRNDQGHLISRSGDILRRKLRAGRYFAAVRADGHTAQNYTLSRISRVITSTHVVFNGKRSAQVAPGAGSTIRVDVTGGVAGPVEVTIEKFDPLAGWQFFRRARVRAAGGHATVGFLAPTVGRWRATAQFLGTRGAAPSDGRFAYLKVAGPLRERR